MYLLTVIIDYIQQKALLQKFVFSDRGTPTGCIYRHQIDGFLFNLRLLVAFKMVALASVKFKDYLYG